jgi:hypothetical protein
MEDIENVLAHFPLNEKQSKELDELRGKALYKVNLIIEITNILKKEPSNFEEAAMLFNRAKPLAEMLIKSGQKKN